MLKACWYGARSGFLFSLAMVISFFFIFIFGGEFAGSALGSASFVLFICATSPGRVPYRLPSNQSRYYLFFKDLVWALVSCATFYFLLLAVGWLSVNMKMMQKLQPVEFSVSGFLCGGFVGMALVLFYVVISAKKRKKLEANKEA